MAKPASRLPTPDAENEHSLATPRAKAPQLLASRESLSSITNSVSSKRILPAHLQSAAKPKRVTSDSMKAGVRQSIVEDASSSSSETPARSSKLMRPPFAASSSSAATPQPRRKRTDAEPATITPRPKMFGAGPSDMRKMQSVNDISRLTAASHPGDESTKLLDIEPVKAYLRIRPPPQDAQKETARPYIEVVSNTEVLMHPPSQSAYGSSIPGARSRTTSLLPPTKYIFSKVFGSSQASESSGAEQDMSQSAFFQHTTLPLVEALLRGESGLMFTYGVTNSGKSHTVMGNNSPGGAGILPRALDVIFNSIKGLESSSNIQPVGVSGVQRADKFATQADASNSVGVNPFMLPGLNRKVFAESSSRAAKPAKLIEHDDTKISVDRNLRYSVFVSYVEIYNEKLFDLLDVSPNATIGRSESVRGSNWSLAALANAAPGSLPSSASSNTLHRKPLTLKNDHENGGKYVAGLREIKIDSAEEARDLLHRGQENRAVFGTLANRASSRSHGIFTIKVIRHHGGLTHLSDEDLDSFTTARLSIVDLAGSERVANTGLASGDRLKEAGNINKSLMCLGQCLETLRKNQIRLMGTTEGGQAQTVKRRMSIVPFRHSKLTELFQSFFVGEGKAVMIVNANPYDTGFDENSHVMKFSAIAKEVAVPRHVAPVTKTLPPLPPHEEERMSGSRSLAKSKSSIEISRSDSDASADITIVEDEEEDGDEQSDPFVDMLLERHEELRQKLYAAELRCATIEAQVREEMANEIEERLREMEDLYTDKMLNDAEQNEHFMNRKIDLLVSTNARNEPDLVAEQDSDLSDEDDYESGHEQEEEEVEGALAAKGRGEDHSMSEISGGESVFDDATEGDVSHSRADDDESDNGSADDVEESAILKPGRPSRSMKKVNAMSISSDESVSDGDDAEESSEESEDEDEDQSMSQVSLGPSEDSESDSDDADAEDDDDDEYSEDEADKADKPGKIHAESSHGEVYVEIPDLSIESISSAFNAASASESSFDVDAESESEEEAPAPPRKKSGRPSNATTNASRGSNGSTATARGRRSSNKSRSSQRDASILLEASALTDLSDASMVMEEKSPKKKRKFGKKAAMQEDDYIEQVGDSSLVEAVYQSTTSGNTSRASKSFGGSSRKSRG